MVTKENSDGFATDALDDASKARLLRNQEDSPTASALGRVTASHRDDRRLLPLVEEPPNLGSNLFGERVFEPIIEVAPTHAPDTPRIGSERLRDIDDGNAVIQEKE